MAYLLTNKIAIGWALTGATNSSQPNLSFLYQLQPGQGNTMPSQQEYNPQYNQSTSYQNMAAPPSSTPHASNPRYPQMTSAYQPSMVNTSTQNNSGQMPSPHKYTPMASEAVSTSDANLLLGLNSPFTNSNTLSSGPHVKFEKDMASQQSGNRPASDYPYHSTPLDQPGMSSHDQNVNNQHVLDSGLDLHGADMMIESQDIDMNTLHGANALPFSINGDLMPYLEYLPQDVLSYFGDHQTYDPMMNENDPNNPQRSSQR